MDAVDVVECVCVCVHQLDEDAAAKASDALSEKEVIRRPSIPMYLMVAKPALRFDAPSFA